MARDVVRFNLLEDGRWSGGGSVLLANAREASERHPIMRGSVTDVPVLARNLPKHGRYPRSRFVFVPQNAWVWKPIASGPAERALISALRIGTSISYRRALGVLRISEAIPAHPSRSTSQVIHNVLDRGFEDAREASFRIDLAPADDAIVCVGANYGFRDLPLLVRAHTRYRREGGRRSLLLMGPLGQRKPERALEAALKEAGPNAVRRLRSTRAECLSAMSRAHLVVFPARIEASPVSVLEAAAVARQVLLSDIAGHRGVVASIGAEASPDYFRAHDEDQLVAGLFGQEDSPTGRWTTGLERSDVRAAARVDWGDKVADFLTRLAETIDVEHAKERA